MRHANKVKKLGRTHAHRHATMAALSTALITHKRITTTLAKAKALRGWVEPIIHRAKDDSTHSRRLAFRDLGNDKEAVKLLFDEVAGAIGERPGGYTRVVKLGQRPGDAAEMAVIEIVDFNDVKPEGASAAKRKTRRSRRPVAKGEAAPKAGAAPRAPKAEAKAPAAAVSGKDAAGKDDFTKLRGIGPVFATALHDAGITTFKQLARADLQTLRDAVEEHTKVTEEAANEETWAAQAALAAAGDWEGHSAYVEGLDAKGQETDEAPAATSAPDADDTAAAAEGTAADVDVPAPGAPDAAEQAIPNPHAGGEDHSDAPQGGPTGEGPPPPEAGPDLRGHSGHRG